MRRNTRLVSRVLGTALSGVAMFALSTEAWSEVGEIIVTTRKREENLQVVPIAVDAITAGEIERKGIVNLEKVLEQSSSLILDQAFSPQDLRIVVRGLSPTRGRQNVAILQDGIDISSESIGTAGGSLLINPRLFDIERVEVVKGPQNALYGRSAFNGAINYITRKPGDSFDARAGTDIGSDGQLEVAGSVSGPLGEGLSAGLTAQTWSHDGFYQNLYNGEDMGDTEGSSVAATLVWTLSDSLKISARGEYLSDEFGVTPFGVPKYSNAPDPTRPQFNTRFTMPALANVDPDGLGPLNAPTSATSALGVKGDIPDGDDIAAAMSPDPRTGDNYEGTTRDIGRATLTIEWDTGPVLLTALSHYADASTNQIEGAEDVDASVADPQASVGFLNITNCGPTRCNAAGEVRFDNDTTLFSQEIRLQSDDADDRIRWVGGVLYWDESSDQKDGSFTCIAPGGTPCSVSMANIRDIPVPPGGVNPLGGPYPINPDMWMRDTEHLSVYGLVDIEVLDWMRVILEDRLTWEESTVGGPSLDNGIYSSIAGFNPTGANALGPGTNAAGVTTVAGVNKGSVDDTFNAWKATVQFTPADNQMYYVSVAEARKPKGISALNVGFGPFDPENSEFKEEKLINYEVGAKTDWLDGRLRVNGAVFFEDFKNKQVSAQVPSATNPNLLTARTVNAGEAEIWGAELELAWFPTDNLSLSLGYTWLDTEYTDYTVVAGGAGQIAYAGNCVGVVPTGVPAAFPPGTFGTACQVSYEGNELEGAPENALVGGARYQQPLVGGTDWFVEADVEFQDDRFVAADNQLIFPSYWMANFRAGVSNDAWDIVAYVDNAFDDDTVKTGFADGDVPTFANTFLFQNHATIILPDPRTYGLRINYRFAGAR